MTLRFKVPFTNQPITSITLSGLQFSAPLQSEQPSAQCSVDNSVPMESGSPVPSLPGALAELKMSFQAPGLPVGSGSFGVGMLAVTCRITKLVNAPSASVATSSVSVAIFENSLPLYFQSGIMFPALFGQSLVFKRPRVSYDLFCFLYIFLTFFPLTHAFVSRSPCRNIWRRTLTSQSLLRCIRSLLLLQAPCLWSQSREISLPSGHHQLPE